MSPAPLFSRPPPGGGDALSVAVNGPARAVGLSVSQLGTAAVCRGGPRLQGTDAFAQLMRPCPSVSGRPPGFAGEAVIV